jgi:uncharacterized protein (DUF488 family)
MSGKIVFTVGHSTHDIEHFIALLSKHDVSCLIDVRSSPYSRIAPQFNRETLSSTLKRNEILYAHFEKEFGARHTDPALLDEDGKVNFDKVRESPEFKQGLQRLNNALELGYSVALMCSEADPFDCHRFSMISYQLVKEGLQVHHILKDGQIVDNNELEKRLLEKHQRKLPQSTLFETVTREMQIEAAYRLIGKRIAFSALKPEEDSISSEDASHD